MKEQKALIGIEKALKIKSRKIGNGSQRAVFAKDLYVALRRKDPDQHANEWVERRIANYGFVEGEDYTVCFPKKGKQTSRGGHNKKDYLLTIDAAKEFAMLEKTQIGRQVRKYFIACEKELLRYKGLEANWVDIEKQFQAAIRIAKTLGYNPSETIEEARRVVKNDSDIDVFTYFTNARQKVFEANHTHTEGQIGRQIGFIASQVKDAFYRSSVLMKDRSVTKGTKYVPTNIRSEAYIHDYNPDTRVVKYNDLAIDLAYVVLTGSPKDWDFKNHRPYECGHERLKNKWPGKKFAWE